MAKNIWKKKTTTGPVVPIRLNSVRKEPLCGGVAVRIPRKHLAVNSASMRARRTMKMMEATKKKRKTFRSNSRMCGAIVARSLAII